MRCQISRLALIFGVIIFVGGLCISSQDEIPCHTSYGTEGICVDIQKCPYNTNESTTSNCSFLNGTNLLCCPMDSSPQKRSPPQHPPSLLDTFDFVLTSGQQILGLGPRGQMAGQGNNKRPRPRPTSRPTTTTTTRRQPTRPSPLPPTKRPFVPTLSSTTRTTTTAAPQDLPGPRANFPTQCGIRTGNTVTKIVGGSIAKLNSWPWMAALFMKTATRTNISFICGGSLIHKDYVLTAAHCLQSSANPEDYVIKLGEHDVNNDTDGAQPLEIGIQEMTSHEGYQAPNLYHDIALLRLDQQVFFNNRINPVCLPNTNLRSNLFDGWTAFVAGWGLVQYGGTQSSVLREVSIPVVSVTQCDQSYRQLEDYSTLFAEGVNVRFVCAGSSTGGKDACQGDSGGPLTVLLNNGRWNQIGIVSFGHKCAEPGFPGAYTRVTEYIDWISANIK